MFCVSFLGLWFFCCVSRLVARPGSTSGAPVSLQHIVAIRGVFAPRHVVLVWCCRACVRRHVCDPVHCWVRRHRGGQTTTEVVVPVAVELSARWRSNGASFLGDPVWASQSHRRLLFSPSLARCCTSGTGEPPLGSLAYDGWSRARCGLCNHRQGQGRRSDRPRE